MKSKKIKVMRLVAFVFVLIILITACKSETRSVAEPVQSTNGADNDEGVFGGILRIAQQTAPSSLDPVQYSTMSNYEIGIHIFETPLIADDVGYLWPGVCKFEMDEEHTWLKLTVRDGVTFHNGDKVDIHDVVASVKRAGKWSSRLREGFEDYLSDTEIVDDMTVIYHFKNPAYNAPYMLGSFTNGSHVMPKEIVESLSDEEIITDDAQLIGTGPYMLKEWVRDNYTIVEKYDNYIVTDADTTGFGSPKVAYFDEIKWTVVGDAMARTNGIMANEYDVAGTLVNDMTQDILNSGCQLIKSWRYWTPNIMFNLSENRANSPIADVNLRKAIRAVIDYDALFLANGRRQGEYKLDPCLVMEGSPYHNNILMVDYNVKDTELAKRYLEASSYNGEEIIIICSESASFYKTALPLSQMMQDVGINVNLQIIDKSAYASYRADKNNASSWDICMLENQKQFNPMSSTVWLGGNDTSVGWWFNEDIETLKQVMRTNPIGSKVSVEAFEEFCNIVSEEVPYILTGEFSTLSFTRESVVVKIEGPVSYYWNSWFAK